MGLELLKNNTIEEKIDKFLELCKEDGSDKISKKGFYSLLKLNVSDYEDRSKLKASINEIFKEYDKEGTG